MHICLRKARHRSRLIRSFIFVRCPSLLYVVVGAYPNNISSDIIFHVRIHPTKLYTFFITPPAEVICLLRSRKRTVLSLSVSGWRADQAHSKWWTLQQHQIFFRRIRAIYYYWYNTRFSGRIMAVLQPHLQPHGQNAHSTWQPNSTHATIRCTYKAYSAAPWNNERPRRLD